MEHNSIRSPEDVFAVMNANFAETAVKKAQMLAMDTTKKIIGGFTHQYRATER